MQFDETEKRRLVEKSTNEKQKSDNNKIEVENQKELNPVIQNLLDNKNIELLYLKAESLFKNYELSESYKLCKSILALDSFHFPTLTLYSELLVERKVII